MNGDDLEPSGPGFDSPQISSGGEAEASPRTEPSPQKSWNAANSGKPNSSKKGPVSAASAARKIGGNYVLEVEDIATYTVLLDRGDRFKYGIAYRAFEGHGVILMGVLPNTPADTWNMVCEPDVTLCAGDTIIEANQQTAPKAIVEELLNSTQVLLHIQKTGPRWHIIGDGAQPKVIPKDVGSFQPANSVLSAADKHAKAVEAQALVGVEEEKGELQPLHCLGWLSLFLAIFLPNAILLIFFSDVGFGLQVFGLFTPEDVNMQGNGVVCLGAICLVLLIVLDWHKWQSKTLKSISAGFVAYFSFAGLIMKARFYPFAPLVIIFFHIPVFLGHLKGRSLSMVTRKGFYLGVTVCAFAVAILMGAVWLFWMSYEEWDGTNFWGDATKEKLVMDSQKMYDDFKIEINGRTRSLNYFWDCSPDWKQDYEYEHISTFRYMDGTWSASLHKIDGNEKEDRGGACARVKTIWFLNWTTPMSCVGLNLIIAVFCFINGVLINVSDTSKLEKVIKQFMLMICFLVFTMYVSSSVAGASMRLTGVIIAFCALGLVVLCIWLYLEIGRQAITSQVRNSKLMQSLIKLATSDWVRACVLIGTNVLIPTFLCINMATQWVRKRRGLVPKDDQKYTAAASRILMAVRHWNWASILIKANWLVMLYWTLSVGVAKLTYVFLSWLNEELLKIPFVWVIIIFFIIGFTMFMLPPVPGVPVYICAGILLSARARDIPEAGNFWGGMCIAIVETLILKICAVCGQYTIGYFFGKSVKVQQLIGVDKPLIRAIEQILDTRGLNLPKVSILVGGPDWPTSVLCGILKLNLFQCCLGTLPVIFVSSPCVIAGAFLSNPGMKTVPTVEPVANGGTTTTGPPVKQNETWQSLSTFAAAIAVMGQLAVFVLAAYYTQEVVHRDGEELAKPRREHEAVAALTRKEADYVNEYNNVLNWTTLLTSRKRLILASTISMLMSCFIFVLMDEICFRPFQVSSKISDPFDKEGLDGDIMNLVYPLGWFATFCFFFACSLHFAFLRWAKKEAEKRYAELVQNRPPPVEDDEDEQ